MKFAFTELSLPKRSSLAVPVFADNELSPTAKEVNELTGGALTRALETSRFKGNKATILRFWHRLELKYLVLFCSALGNQQN